MNDAHDSYKLAVEFVADLYNCDALRNGHACPSCDPLVPTVEIALLRERGRCIEIAQGVLREQGSTECSGCGLEKNERWNAAVRAVVKKLRGKQASAKVEWRFDPSPCAGWRIT